MKTHEITLHGYRATTQEHGGILLLGTAASYGTERLHLIRDDDTWKNLSVDVTYHLVPDDSGITEYPDEEDYVKVPAAATSRATQFGTITIRGIGDGVQCITYNLLYQVGDHAQIPGQATGDPPESWWIDLQNRMVPDGGEAGQQLLSTENGRTWDWPTTVKWSYKPGAYEVSASAIVLPIYATDNNHIWWWTELRYVNIRLMDGQSILASTSVIASVKLVRFVSWTDNVIQVDVFLHSGVSMRYTYWVQEHRWESNYMIYGASTIDKMVADRLKSPGAGKEHDRLTIVNGEPCWEGNTKILLLSSNNELLESQDGQPITRKTLASYLQIYKVFVYDAQMSGTVSEDLIPEGQAITRYRVLDAVPGPNNNNIVMSCVKTDGANAQGSICTITIKEENK
ncbi:MAG: hypothetical protein U0L91_00665 [Gemmiger sp.]|uniref:hypothetical protein n=1 Tax=Gemmiger sp. TaxID=2049027 RepID=UPI002E784D32|nr:hypothetical protein [Gemmiger sp.]MEE0799771.1 hypothetical protein [Gemmiger sp.]